MNYSRLKSLTRTLKSHHHRSPLPSLSSTATTTTTTTIRSPPQPFSTTASTEPPKSPPQHFQTLEALRHRLSAKYPTLNDLNSLQSSDGYSIEVGKIPLPKLNWIKDSVPGVCSVDRDQGSGHFTETVQKLKMEALVAKSGLGFFAQNTETAEELQSAVSDHRASFKQSVAKDHAPAGTLTKTSIMLGCGETPDQVVKTMEKMRVAGVNVEKDRPLGMKMVRSAPNVPKPRFWHLHGGGIREIMDDYVHNEMSRNLFLIYFRLFQLILLKDVFIFLFYVE